MVSRCAFDFVCNSIIGEIKRTDNSQDGRDIAQSIDECKDDIFKNYSGIVEYIRSNYIKDTEGLIDRHKCAAAYMIAFLNYLNIPEKNLKKEFFAIYVGLLVLKIIIREDNKNFSDCDVINFIDNHENKFIFPKCIRDNEPYEYNWAAGIHYDRIGNRLSVLSLANTLFFVERYNRTLAEIEMLKRQEKYLNQENEDLKTKLEKLNAEFQNLKTGSSGNWRDLL